MAQSQYATIAELKSLAITTQAATRFGDTAMDAALQAASSEADSYITSQFTLPLAADGWDMSLRIAVCNMAAFRLYSQFGFNPSAPADTLIVDRYKAALAWLAQIRDEEIFPQWTDSSGSVPSGTSEAGPFVISDDPVGFTNRGTTTNPWNLDPWWNW